ncbi:MAG: sulfurtransferase [bacterium]
MSTATASRDEEKIQDYADSDSLVTTQWVEDYLDRFQDNTGDLRLVEVDVDTTSYDESHIPGAIGWDWESQLCDQVQRDLTPKDELESLLEESGISDGTTVVLYGDNHNWFAAWALWQLEYYGHDDVRLMDGGRQKWIEEDRELTSKVPDYPSGNYSADEPDESIRAYSDNVRQHIEQNPSLVDVRSPEEFTGEKIAPEGMSETAQRGGHIPGASNISWSDAVQEDGSFKPVDELREIYENKGDIKAGEESITYCRIGERSSHSWFVLSHLLGHENVRNYDGSWTEWGNLVGAPIERGS